MIVNFGKPKNKSHTPICVLMRIIFFNILLVLTAGQLLGRGKGPLGLGELTKPIENVLTKTTSLLTKQFDDFKNTFKKTYNDTEEERKRLEIYSNNHNSILDINKVVNLPYKLKINEFADLALDEFNKLLNGLKVNKKKNSKDKDNNNAGKVKPSPEIQPTVTDNVDWRTRGAVTLARSQGLCGSCYAFAAAGALEAQYFLKTGKLQYLSPQNIMDCTQGTPYDNNGCVSGAVDPAFDFIKTNGIDPEAIYPYEEKLGQACRFVREQSAGNVTGYVLLDEGDDKGLEEAVRKVGPVAVGIDAHAKSFQFYSDGIYYEPSCRASVEDLNHAVLIIGIGTERSGEKYWLIKNSYGPTWGTNGFGKIARNVTNHCGIATYAVYPIL